MSSLTIARLFSHSLDHPWPGNVRELHGLVESMYILSDRPVLTALDLPEDFARSAQSASRSTPTPIARAKLESVEREAIVAELAEHGHNMSMVARRLGISRSTLYRKMKQYELKRGT